MPPAYTQDHSQTVLTSHSARRAATYAAYILPHIHATTTLLDIGCGPGTITIDFASLAPRGRIVGVDYSSQVVETARQNLREAESAAGKAERGACEFRQGDVYDLREFADGLFDVVHAHQCLIHLADPVRALREMRRVCKPGGVVGVREADLGVISINPELPGLLAYWEAMRGNIESGGSDVRAGRRLKAWALAAGFSVEEMEVSAVVDLHESAEQRSIVVGGHAERFKGEMGVRAKERGLVTGEDVELFEKAWREWGEREDGWLGIMHGQIVCLKGKGE